MLLEPASALDADDAARLAMAEEACPGLGAQEVRFDHSGGDHVVLIVDDRYVFRFPRREAQNLDLETMVLQRLQRRAVPATPRYDYVDPAGRFAGYPLISGEPLTPARFASLDDAVQERVIAEAVQFLIELHFIPPESVAAHATWPTMWTAAHYADRAVAERLPLIAATLPATADLLARFYAGYRTDEATTTVIVHGDLVGDHILIDERAGRLSGIIDFGDVALGDPAQDLLGFWAYGEQVVRRAVDLYRSRFPGDGLLARSYRHFVRYRLDHIFEALLDGADVDIDRGSAEFAALLSGANAFPHDHHRR